MANTKFEFTGETLQFEDKTLHRIRAVRDFGDVKAGSLGGWLQHETNLAQEGECWVADDAKVLDSAYVVDSAYVTKNAKVAGTAVVSESAYITGNAQVTGGAIVSNSACVVGNSKVFDRATVQGSAYIEDFAEISGEACIAQNARVSEKSIVSGNAYIAGFAHIREDSTIYNDSDHFSITRVGDGFNRTITVTRCSPAEGLHGLRVTKGFFTGPVEEFLVKSKIDNSPRLHESYVALIKFAYIHILGIVYLGAHL